MAAVSRPYSCSKRLHLRIIPIRLQIRHPSLLLCTHMQPSTDTKRNGTVKQKPDGIRPALSVLFLFCVIPVIAAITAIAILFIAVIAVKITIAALIAIIEALFKIRKILVHFFYIIIKYFLINFL